MASDEGVGQAQFAAELAHLVLEELAQRLDQLHVHALGKAADIVVALDGDRGSAGEANALDHVRIERALGQEIGAAVLARSLLEPAVKGFAVELPFGLGLVDAGEPGGDKSPGVTMKGENRRAKRLKPIH